jgi:uncharacterized membrane protein
MRNSLFSSDRSKPLLNLVCAASYVTMFPAAMLLILPPTVRNPRIRFHACQSILLNWFLVSATFIVGMFASLEQILGSGMGHAAELKWVLRLFTLAFWAIATVRVAKGKTFRIPGVAALAQRQANGRLFRLFDDSEQESSVDDSPALEASVSTAH